MASGKTPSPVVLVPVPLYPDGDQPGAFPCIPSCLAPSWVLLGNNIAMGAVSLNPSLLPQAA